MPTRGVLFDLFGTLVDYEHGRTSQDFSHSHKVCTSFGYTISQDEMVNRWDEIFVTLENRTAESGREFSMHEAGSRFVESLDGDPDHIAPLFEAYLSDWGQNVVPIMGVANLVARLRQDYEVGLITNTHHAPMVHDLLARIGLSGAFGIVTTSVEHGTPKPDPSIFETTLDALKLNATESVYVGDNYVADYCGARNAGMDCYLVGTHARVPRDNVIPSVLDLPGVLSRRR